MGEHQKDHKGSGPSNADLKEWAIDYLGGECLGCGLKYNRWQYDVHHIDPKEKEYNFGHMTGMVWAKITKELDKCVLLCKNCHADIHHHPLSKKMFGFASALKNIGK